LSTINKDDDDDDDDDRALSILYHFWDIHHWIMASPWNHG